MAATPGRSPNPSGRFVAGLVLVVAGLVAMARPAGAAGAAGEEGLELRSETSYELMPAEQIVHVNQTVTVTNTKPEQREGNVLRRFFFDGIKIPVPVEAQSIAAMSNGVPLVANELDAAGKPVVPVEIKFPNLFFGETRVIYFAYDLHGDPPRSKGLVRVNSAYASFTAFGVGDQGKVDVSVVIPAGFETETFGAAVPPNAGSDHTVYAASAIGVPDDWYLHVSARADAALTKRDVDVSGRALSIRSWPGDDEWAAWVDRQLSTALPQLQTLVGEPWPIKDRLEIVEAATPYLRGYAGWYQPQRNRIEVGENLDERTLLHELSHVWFNRSLFTARWINEGLAEEYSAQALTSLGHTVDEPKAIDAADANAVALEDWSAPVRRDSAGDVEAFGYNAAYSVIHQLTAEIGVAGMAKVVDAGLAHRIAYAGADGNEVSDEDPDWHRFLDLLEERGGSTKATELFKSYVVGPELAKTLDARTATRATYHQLAADGNGWQVPQGVRTLMAAWNFEPATQLMAHAHEALAARDQLAAQAAQLGVAVPSNTQARYESAVSSDDLDALVADATSQRSAIESLLAAKRAVEAPRSRLQRVGLYYRHPELDLAEALRFFTADDTANALALAERARSTVAHSASVGRQRVAMGVGGSGAVVGAGIGGVVVARRRRRARRADAASFAEPVVAAGIEAWEPRPTRLDADTPDTGAAAAPTAVEGPSPDPTSAPRAAAAPPIALVSSGEQQPVWRHDDAHTHQYGTTVGRVRRWRPSAGDDRQRVN